MDSVLRWRAALALFLFDVAMFMLANVTTTGKNGEKNYPGVVSNVFWYIFLIGALLLIVLGIVALFRRLRSRKLAPLA